MKLNVRGLIPTIVLAFFTTSAVPVMAAHAEDFFDSLLFEVTNRLATVGTNLTAAERRSLTTAATILQTRERPAPTWGCWPAPPQC